MLAVVLAVAHFGLSIVHGEYGLDAMLSLRAEAEVAAADLEALTLERERLLRMIDAAVGSDAAADLPETQLRRTYSLIADGERVLVR